MQYNRDRQTDRQAERQRGRGVGVGCFLRPVNHDVYIREEHILLTTTRVLDVLLKNNTRTEYQYVSDRQSSS